MRYLIPKIVAEIGCNHKGDFEIAKRMIKIAAEYCNVDVVKFQKRDNKFFLTDSEYNSPHPVPYNSYGKTYGEHREALEFTINQHIELKEYCEEVGVIYSCSVWDINSAMSISRLNPKMIKIPSARNNDWFMLEWLLKNYKGMIHISLGMTTMEELKEITNLISKFKRRKNILFYICTSNYPIKAEDICLLEIIKLKEGLRLETIGFSGHHLGIAPDVAAYTLGATWIERHFTLDRTWKGTDHAASLEPEGLRKLKRDLIAVKKSLTYKNKDVLDIEISQRDKLKFKKK